jgi:hypothetical protein
MSKGGMVKKLFTIDTASQQSILLGLLVIVGFGASTIPRNERALFIMGNPVGAFAATPDAPAALDGPQGPIAGFIRHLISTRGGAPRHFGGGRPGGLLPNGLPGGVIPNGPQVAANDLPAFGPGDGFVGAPGGGPGDDGTTSGGGPGGPSSPIGDLPGGDVGSIPRPGSLPPPPVGPVPEPDTWLLLVGGAFFAAAQLRRARRLRLEALVDRQLIAAERHAPKLG